MATQGCNRPIPSPDSANRQLHEPGNPSDASHQPDPVSNDHPWSTRFLSKVDIGGPDECWEWTGSRHPVGHGRLRIGGRTGTIEYAHRLAWLLWVGEIPPQMQIRHTCDNPPCCNPAHLLLGTQAENCLDMVKRRRHGREKITPDQVRYIRSFPWKRGLITMLAKKFDVHPQTITEIRHGRQRRDVH
jgi:Pectobacterium phage endonuclease